MVPGKIVTISQTILYPFMHFFFKFFFNSRLILENDFKENESYIFTPNHIWNMDPFLIFYLFPFKKLYRLFPIRFMTAKEYMQNPIIGLFLGLLGCYQIDGSELKKSIYFSKKGDSLCIFIQGKMDGNYKTQPKIGAVYLERKLKNSYIVPVRIKFDKKLNIRNILLRKINVEVKFMKKFRHEKFSKDLQPLANELLDKIKNGDN